MAVDPGMLFVLGEIYQRQGEIARSKQAAFADIWRDFDCDEVKSELQTILGSSGGVPRKAATSATKGPRRVNK
jgi:hypothetical protein